MKNIHLIPTDKPSRLFYLASNLHLEQSQLIAPKNYQNIYITSDEEIKEGYYLDLTHNVVMKSVFYSSSDKNCKKIILTDNKYLIKDGVQAIDNEFLEWFVKNPSCEEVDVELFPKFSNKLYKIIIPKEESNYNMKQEILDEMERLEKEQELTPQDWLNELFWEKSKQETLEEAAEKFATDCTLISDSAAFKGFTEGAAWQAERSYSEEEVLNIQKKYNEYIQKNFNPEFSVLPFKVFFEQFKKK